MRDADVRLVPKERDSVHLRELLAGTLSSWLEAGDLPTAVVIYNDLMSVQFYHVARELGIRIPEALSVTSFDNEPLGESMVPSLTSVSPEFFEVGRTAVDMLVAGARNPNLDRPLKVLCPTRLQIRDSVTPPGRRR
jgi:DNA-binding LacI/PurR family transcriptional regulator